MTNRVISYVFKGDFGSLTTGLKATSTQAAKTTTEVDGLKVKTKELSLEQAIANERAARLQQTLQKQAKSAVDAERGIGTASRAVRTYGAGIAAAGVIGLAAIEKANLAFDKSMSDVQAATHATAAEMAKFRSAALDASKTTQYSAAEAAGAIEALAKAGVSTQDILGGGLTGALNLAAAGSLDVGQAAEYAASAMTQFHLAGDQVGHIADLLAAGAGKAQGDVSDLGMALAQSGLVAAQTGLSIEETTGTLAAFASAGLIGSDAGTSFKTMLQALTPNSKQARTEMEKLGISAYDAQGNFVGMAKFAGNLRKALSGLSTEQQNAALKTIFGSDAVRAAAVIYQDGADGIQGWIDKTNDAGYAAETAAIKLDNLSGDLKKLGAALNAQAIQSGEGSQSFLRELTQSLTALVNLGDTKVPLFNQRIESIGQGLAKQTIGLDGAAHGLKELGHWLGVSGDETEKAGDAAGKATAPTEAYANAVGYSSVTAEDAGQSIGSMVKAMKDQRTAALSAFDAVTQYGSALDDAQKAAAKGKRGINANTEAGRENRQALSQLAAAWNNQSDAVRNNSAKFKQARTDFINTAVAMGVPIDQARRLAKSLRDLPDKTVVTVAAETDPAATAIANIKKQLASIPRSIRTDYYVNQVNAINKRGGIPKASGGPIYGPGTGTSDDVPIWASNGEFMMRTSAVKKYGLGMMDAINQGRYANGGLIGYANGGPVMRVRGGAGDLHDFLQSIGLAGASLKQLKRALDASNKALEKEKNTRADLISQKSSYADTVAGTFQHDPFGNGASGLLTQLNADTNDANAMKKALAAAAAHGLDVKGGLYGALAASGDLNTAQQLAHMSRAQIDRYEAAYQARQNATGSLGATAASGQFDALIKQQDRTIARLEKTIGRLEKSVERGSEAGTRKGMDDRNRNTSQRSRAGR